MTFGGEIKPFALEVATMQALMEQATENLDGFFFPSYCDTKRIKKINLKSILLFVLSHRHAPEKHDSVMERLRYFRLGLRPEHKV